MRRAPRNAQRDALHRSMQRISVATGASQRDQRHGGTSGSPCIGESRHHALGAPSAERRDHQGQPDHDTVAPFAAPKIDGSMPRREQTIHHARPRQASRDTTAPMAAPVAPRDGTNTHATTPLAATPPRTSAVASFWYLVMDSMKPTSPSAVVAQYPHSRTINGTYFLPGKPHRQRSLASYRPWGRKESHTTE